MLSFTDHSEQQAWCKAASGPGHVTEAPPKPDKLGCHPTHVPLLSKNQLPASCESAYSIILLTSPLRQTANLSRVGLKVNTTQYCTDSTVQYSTAQRSAAQRSAAQRSTAQHSAAQHNTTQHNTAQHSAAQHNTTQHNTAQHNTTQHNTVYWIRQSWLKHSYIHVSIYN